MKGDWTIIKRLDLEIHSIYTYEDFARDQLLKFKDHKDKWLSELFLKPHLTCFYVNFFRCVIVYVPSSKDKTKERGYTPNKLILKTQILRVIDDVFEKKIHHKQSEMNRSQRHKIKDVIILKDPEAIKHKHVLLFDDLCTTGHSLKACYDLLKPYAKSIKVLALFHHEI